MAAITARAWQRLVASLVAATGVAAALAGCQAAATGSEPAETGGEGSASEASEAPNGPGPTVTVAHVIDGDTIELTDGRRVRLVQIDAPEPMEGECYSRKATLTLRELLPAGTGVRLEVDPKLDRRDQYGRLLRYVWKGKTNVNLRLVREGAASVWFYQGERGKYAKRLLRAAERAKADAVGLWQACRGTVLDPLQPIHATSQLAEEPPPERRSAEAPLVEETGGPCDPSYPDLCIPPPPPDLDCAQVGGSFFTVRPPDPHAFDGDGDGIGCES